MLTYGRFACIYSQSFPAQVVPTGSPSRDLWQNLRLRLPAGAIFMHYIFLVEGVDRHEAIAIGDA
jgi:hypothetical protein